MLNRWFHNGEALWNQNARQRSKDNLHYGFTALAYARDYGANTF